MSQKKIRRWIAVACLVYILLGLWEMTKDDGISLFSPVGQTSFVL